MSRYRQLLLLAKDQLEELLEAEQLSGMPVDEKDRAPIRETFDRLAIAIIHARMESQK